MTGGLEIHTWEGIGFKPLVASHDWLVSILNWEPIFDLDKFGEVERHNKTDEVFVLTRGQALLFTSDDHELRIEEMIPGALYKVLKGTWHNLLATRDASWIIVENQGTDNSNSEFRQLTEIEKEQIIQKSPPGLSEV
jgi:mannose-6-phosphate isomerase-like protein (cupin superfamily)